MHLVGYLYEDSQLFTRLLGSLPCLPEPPTLPCPQPGQSISRPSSYFAKIYFNIILPSTTRFSYQPRKLSVIHHIIWKYNVSPEEGFVYEAPKRF